MAMPEIRSISSPEHDLVERRAGVVLGQHALERLVVLLDRAHGVVDELADRPGCLALALRCDQRASFGYPEDVVGEVLVRVLRVGSSSASSSARFASKASEMYLRKIRPSATCL
jgi:hypothetical protein